MKRAFVVHGWYGSSKEPLLQWSGSQLNAKGYQTKILDMPDSENPKIEKWVNKLKESVGEVDEEALLVGHSIGRQAIMRFLESLPSHPELVSGSKKIDKAIFIAPWFFLTNWDGITEEEIRTMAPWLSTPIDLDKVRTKADEFITIFSDNDPFVPLEKNRDKFREDLGAKVIVEKDKGHYSSEDGATDLPILLKLL